MYAIEVLENGVWRRYGKPSKDFSALYEMCRKFAESGRKARVVKV